MMRRWAPVAAALTVTAVAVAVSLLVGRAGGGDPPTLRLAAGGGTGTAVAADTPMADTRRTAGKRAAPGSSFELVGTLPTGPDEAQAHPLPKGAAEQERVRRLATALGITTAPERVGGAWRAGPLRVEDSAGNPWSLSPGCGPDQPVSSDGAASGCARSSTGTVAAGEGSSDGGAGWAPAPDGTTATSPAAPPPSASPVAVAAARKAALVILAALGQQGADLTIDGGAGRSVFARADPRVAGLPTSGYPTYLEIDAETQVVVGGGGYLGRPAGGSSYPLISAAEAFDNLPELPRPMMLCPANADCPQPAPAKVTGAELGLQLTALADEEAALLPAWLFTVEGWTSPVAQPAIEPRFLRLPEPRTDPGKQVPPVAPPQPTDPVRPRCAFAFDAVFPTDEPNVVVVQYGDSGSCPRANVAPLVKESSDSVVVTLEADGQPDQPCTDDYRQQLVTITLASPLGERDVIDGSRGEPVAVDRTCSRPMGQPPAPKSCTG